MAEKNDSNRPTTREIVTHTNPDWDAITSIWLLKRYGGLDDASVVFVNTAEPDPRLLRRAVAVVDTGKEHDPTRLRFDHHQFVGDAARGMSAAFLVFEWLQSPEITHLAPLVAMINAADTGQSGHGADWSRDLGLHALLQGWRGSVRAPRDDYERMRTDQAALDYGEMLLDMLDRALKMRANARVSLDEYIVYRSHDNLVWGIDKAGPGATYAAFEEGARLVVFARTYLMKSMPPSHEPATPSSYTIGVMRSTAWSHPHVGDLIRTIQAQAGLKEALHTELNRWYLHPAGFFAGRGTRKAPMLVPVEVAVADVAQLLDTMWTR